MRIGSIARVGSLGSRPGGGGGGRGGRERGRAKAESVHLGATSVAANQRSHAARAGFFAPVSVWRPV